MQDWTRVLLIAVLALAPAAGAQAQNANRPRLREPIAIPEQPAKTPRPTISAVSQSEHRSGEQAPAQIVSASLGEVGDFLLETPEVLFSPSLDSAIADVASDPISAYAFVRNAVELLPYPGSMRTSDAVLENLSGSVIDQASLLIALMRRLGLPARYVRGRVAAPVGAVATWLGVSQDVAAFSLLQRMRGAPEYVYNGVNRPGFAGGSIPWEDWSHGKDEQVSV